MYSLIVMTAMAGGGDTSSFNGRFGNLFSGGCQGTVVVSSCHGCTGASCTGCYGSSCHGCTGGVFGSRSTTRRASCFGLSCHGCTGCYGSVEVWGASCHGSSCTGCIGSSCHGCHGGCYGSSTGISYYEGEVISMPSIGTVKLESEDSASANIQIELPAGAKLYVEGQLVDTTTGQFHTPPLKKGKAYYYDMKAVLTVNGKTLTDEKRVVVRGGETTTEKFGPTPLAAK